MQMLLANCYLILGTLVLPLALIPGNIKIVSKWVFGFLSVLLWTPVLNIIKTIIAFARGTANIDWTDPIISVAYQVVLIILIFSVPKIANMLVSQGNDIGNGIIDSVGSFSRDKAISKITSSGSKSSKGGRASGGGSGKRVPSYGK